MTTVTITNKIKHIRPTPRPTRQEMYQEATYRAALELVARIDEDLTRGVRHYRTKAGQLLTTLDGVSRAILSNELMEPEGSETVGESSPQFLA